MSGRAWNSTGTIRPSLHWEIILGLAGSVKASQIEIWYLDMGYGQVKLSSCGKPELLVLAFCLDICHTVTNEIDFWAQSQKWNVSWHGFKCYPSFKRPCFFCNWPHFSVNWMQKMSKKQQQQPQWKKKIHGLAGLECQMECHHLMMIGELCITCIDASKSEWMDTIQLIDDALEGAT